MTSKALLPLLISLLFLPLFTDAQTYTDGPIELQVKVRRFNVTFNRTDQGLLGVGFSPDDLTFNIWARDAANLDGAGWQGGTCLTQNFDPPALSTDFNYTMLNYTYPTATVPQFFDIRMDNWEDDLPTDGLAGFCTGGNRCSFQGSQCCGVVIFGACVGIRTGDDERCNANPFTSGMDYRLGNPCEWYDHGYVSGSCTGNRYQPNIESYWRYTRGTSCANAIDLGTLNIGGSLSHFNSTICYTNNFASSPGKDVVYSFTVNSPIGVTASLCGANGAQFDSYMYLLDPSCTIEDQDDNGCGNQSVISTAICTPGTYFIVVDAIAASEEGLFTLTISEDPSFTFTANVTKQDISCNGLTNGTATSAVTGGEAPYTYAWSNGAGNVTGLTGLATGTYTVTVTDNKGCTTTGSTTIIEPALLTTTVISVDVSCSGANDGSATANPAGGTPPYTYEWSTFPLQTLQTSILLTAGSYFVTVSDANACTAVGVATINSATSINPIIDAYNDISCNGANDGLIDLDANGGNTPYSYIWSTGDVTDAISGLAPGAYTVTIFDATNCNIVQTYNIIEPAVLVASIDQTIDARCFGLDDGSIDASAAGGTLPYTYLWSDGSVTEDIIDVFAGTYTLTVTDANGCTSDVSTTINEPADITTAIVVVDAACFNDSTASIDLTVNGGTLPYDFLWSNGEITEDLANLKRGSYSVLVLDANGCVAFETGVVNQPPILTTTATVTPVLCNGGTTGGITTVSGGGTPPYTYNWSNGAATADITSVLAGTYTLTLSDANACELVTDHTIIEPTLLTLAIAQVNDASCFGFSDGGIDLDVTGGTAPYTYTWSGAQTTQDISGIAAGSYTVTVEDANACIDQISAVVGEPTALSIAIASVDATCFGASDGLVDITVNGGTAPYTYLWSNGATTEDINTLTAGTYNVVVTDGNNCVISDGATVAEPLQLAAVETITPVDCNGSATGSITQVVSGGTTPYTFVWSTGPSTQDLASLLAGNYDVTISDANACSTTKSYVVSEPPALVVTIDQVLDVLCSGAGDGIIDVSANGGVAPLTYAWNSGQAVQDLINISQGTYTLTVTDANACQEIVSAVVNEPAAPLSATLTSVAPSCFGASNGSIDLTPAGGTAPYTFSWNTGDATEDLANIPSGNYSVLIQDANGCELLENAILSTGPSLTATFTTTDVACNGNATGTITVVINGGTPGYIYTWSDGSSNQDLTAGAGTYTLTVTDNDGCSTSLTGTIDEPSALTATISGFDAECNGEGGTAVASVNGGTSPYVYAWSDGQSSSLVNGVAAGDYTLTVTDANNCAITGTVNIQEPTALNLVAASANSTCNEGNDGTVTITATGGTQPYQYSIFTNVFQGTETFTDLSADDYGVLVLDANNCQANVDVTVGEPTGFDVSFADPFVFVTVGTEGQLQGILSGIDTGAVANYSWNPSADLTCMDCLDPMVSVLDPGTEINYVLSVTDTFGCTDTASVTVVGRDDYDVFIPNVFTPNGDGINEVLDIYDLGATQTFEMKIFDRWGELIFKSDNIATSWNGTSFGKPSNSGVYPYIIQGTYINGEEYKKLGTITLMR